ncbi:hypothetical protein [Pseudomonas sp. 2(2015)]|uniref:hypothetical protein n=1 Tax=Pseudomonas sp. 2(2015) TaxID=1619950 RepID=UPI0005EAF530|nr:hypothetical protein [Pseudomonas sp. 2(2015)]KJK19074.1 hypothetical protein UB48_04740 [Pseudomonas sp. 2(2015)]
MDTNKMPTEMEAQFDAAFRAKFGCGIAEVAASGHEDSMALMGAAMWAWQASREAVVVELPPAPARPEEPEFALDDSHMDAYNAAVRMRDACAKAIEAQGLKVKP